MMHFSDIALTFIHIPKTGGTSFRQWVKDSVSVPYVEHMGADKHRRATSGAVLTFVRNPFDRLVSLFHYQGQRALMSKKDADDNGCTNVKRYIDDINLIKLYNQGFDNFIHYTYNRHDTLYEKDRPNWCNRDNQSDWLANAESTIVLKIEDIDREFYKIQNLFECYAPFPLTNQSDHLHYREYYTDQTRQLVAEMFSDDIKMFGYDF